MNPIEQFQAEVQHNIERLGADAGLKRASLDWMLKTGATGAYTYNFNWMGRPIIQYPQDMVAMQELIWAVKPDLIIETGIAHGGSLIMNASLLALLDLCDAQTQGRALDPRQPARKVLGIDIDIRAHNREAIEAHPMATRIQMLQGSSVDPAMVARVKDITSGYQRVLVSLDSNHTHEHVLAELKAYAPLVSIGSYCVVFDTVVEDMPPELCEGRPWGPGNSPLTAAREYLAEHPEFEVDRSIENKLLITVAREGFLRRIA
ncbi:cephalosporin hydroxylase family protein [Castellaniella sp.]|uniref:cephalosporin hydroxylase family protein n=1 Tax=Castellaniella sp. TaxID=1955812 RepID=UPI003C7085E4